VDDRPLTVALMGAFDTKGAELDFVRTLIEQDGLGVFIIDTSVVGKGHPTASVSGAEVAQAGGRDLADLVQLHDRGTAIDVMVRGAAAVVPNYWSRGCFDGIIALGGGAGTAVGTAAMRALPFGVPKVMVTTLASGDTKAYVGGSDLVMIPTVVDIAGINRITRSVFVRAAGAICGMVRAERSLDAQQDSSARPLVAASMFGNTTRAVDQAREILEAAGYEVLVFHATGVGGESMEGLIRAGHIAGVLDLTPTELADEVCGGVLSAGPDRMRGAARTGVPQVVAPGCLDMANFWAMDTVPEKFRDRNLYPWNPQVTLMRTTPGENRALGAVVAARLNEAHGPVAIFVPMAGFSELDIEGGSFWSPEADDAFLEALKADLRPDIPVVLLDVDVNSPVFSEAMANELIAMMDGQAK